MNLNKVISVSNIFNVLTDMFETYVVDVSKTEMMGVSDHVFLHHSLDMPYHTAYEAYNNLKNCIAFKYNGSSRVRTISSLQFVQGISIISRPKRHVYVFNYGYDVDNEQIFVYDKESGRLELTNPEAAEELLLWMLLMRRN